MYHNVDLIILNTDFIDKIYFFGIQGPPPDPAYNYLADRDRDAYFAEKREDNKYRRGFQRKTRGEQRQNPQSASHQGHNRVCLTTEGLYLLFL